MKYTNLLLMALLSFISMYILMYIMVDSFANVYSNLNQLYMAGLMIIKILIFLLLYIRFITNNSITTIGIVINPAMYSVFKFEYTLAKLSTIIYINMYIEINDNNDIIIRLRYFI